MRLSFAVCFSATLFVLIAEHGAESSTCGETDVCSAIKALETKLEKLTTLVTPPGKIRFKLICIGIFCFGFIFTSLNCNFLYSCSCFFL